MLVATHNVFDIFNLRALIETMEDYLTAGMMQAYPDSASVRVILEASRSPGDSKSMDYSGLIVLITTAAPSVGVVQALTQVLLLDMAAVQTAVDNNPDVTPSPNPTARVLRGTVRLYHGRCCSRRSGPKSTHNDTGTVLDGRNDGEIPQRSEGPFKWYIRLSILISMIRAVPQSTNQATSSFPARHHHPFRMCKLVSEHRCSI
jgi:hypothetical protein